MFTGKKILITGGTGSVGKGLVKELLQYKPAVIRILSRDEYKQFIMQKEFQSHQHQLRFLLGDVRDKERLTYAMKEVDFVFHLAALKQVPSCEYNPFEAVQTNVLGTQNIIEAALQNGVEKVLFTSSDKAINPSNTMGASKLIAEKLFISADQYRGTHKTVFSVVRFGNILGSRGSVIPVFFQQIKKNQTMTVTNPNMVRYTMSLSQACQLLLEAMNKARGGEVFVLKMPQYRLGDLVEAFLQIVEEKTGVKKKNIHIEEIGLRPGEKMAEELMMENEALKAIEFEHMFLIPGNRIMDDRSTLAQKDGLVSLREDHVLTVEELKKMIQIELGNAGFGL